MHLKFAPEMSAKLFQCHFLWYGWTNQSIHYMVFCLKKKHNKDPSWSKSENVYTRLYLNKLESTMRVSSDALLTGHRAMANPTFQLHSGCGRATPQSIHSHNWPSGRMQHLLFKIVRKSYFLANKHPKTNFDACMMLQKPTLLLKWKYFFKKGQFEGDIIFCHLNDVIMTTFTNIGWHHDLRSTIFIWGDEINSSPLDKMATISQTIFLDAFSWIKSYIFWLNFT